MSNIETHLNGRVTLHRGDCLDVLARLDECSIDSVVTDPPYHLTSIVKRFGAEGAAPAKGGVYNRSARGFMGKQWDGGEIAFEPETWAAVMRVLKPGGHLLAFGAPKNFGFMQYAIAQAGFEVRDVLCWMFGSGFPKSHNITKHIEGAHQCQLLEPASVAALKLRRFRVELPEGKIGFAAVSAATPRGGERESKTAIGAVVASSDPMAMYLYASTEKIDWNTVSSLNKRLDALCGQTNNAITLTELSTIIGLKIWNLLQSQNTLESTVALNHTALKPAYEPIIMARRPLIGTVAANVLQHGTGAINIDGCRVTAGADHAENCARTFQSGIWKTSGTAPNEITTEAHAQGRWPANVLHDGSDEVVGAFPETTSGSGFRNPNGGKGVNTKWGFEANDRSFDGDSGSAARFFYSSKADSDDRLGSKHPTVKPLDLMQWLVRLVTPKGGTCLDPFAGTGTTGEAAWREGMRAVLIECEPEYCADIARRMELALSGPDERARQAMKEKQKGKPPDHGPLFSEIWDEPFSILPKWE